MGQDVDELIIEGIHGWVNDKAQNEQFEEINKWLMGCKIHLLKTPIILSILTSTFAHKDKLEYRPRLHKKCVKVLGQRRDAMTDDILHEME